jgi:sugar phosphate permease
MLPSVLLLVGALVVLAVVPLGGRPVAALVLLAAVSAFLLLPYSFCAGVMSIDLGGRRASATVSGVVDSAGYLGGVLSGYGVARVSSQYGWPAAFIALAVVGALTAVAVVDYTLRANPREVGS